jgi:hypothetical protein
MLMPLIKCIVKQSCQLLIGVAVVACSTKSTELTRLSNPTNSVDAVIALRETDATVATPTEIYLVKTRSKIDGDPVFRADKVEGLKIFWDGSNVLKIHADKARVFLRLASQEVNMNDRTGRIEVRYEILAED